MNLDLTRLDDRLDRWLHEHSLKRLYSRADKAPYNTSFYQANMLLTEIFRKIAQIEYFNHVSAYPVRQEILDERLNIEQKIRDNFPGRFGEKLKYMSA